MRAKRLGPLYRDSGLPKTERSDAHRHAAISGLPKKRSFHNPEPVALHGITRSAEGFAKAIVRRFPLTITHIFSGALRAPWMGAR